MKKHFSESAMKRLMQARLTPTQGLFAIVILAVIFGISYELYCRLARKVLEARVRSALPRISEEVRAQNQQLVTAIEAYKSAFGFYPPDHVVSRNPWRADAVTNQLLYELVGTVYDSTNNTFKADRFEAVPRTLIKDLFNVDGFKNSATDSARVRHFLSLDDIAVREIHDGPDVNVLATANNFAGIHPSAAAELTLSSWCYISSSPSHNSGKFDLWIEVKALDTKLVIGNWPAP